MVKTYYTQARDLSIIFTWAEKRKRIITWDVSNDKEKNKNETGIPRKRPQRRVVIEKSPIYIDDSDNQEKQKTTSEDNVVLTHFKKTRHNFSWPKFRILDHESNYHKRNTSEVLYINIYKNTINEQGDSEKLFKPYLSNIHKMRKSM